MQLIIVPFSDRSVDRSTDYEMSNQHNNIVYMWHKALQTFDGFSINSSGLHENMLENEELVTHGSVMKRHFMVIFKTIALWESYIFVYLSKLFSMSKNLKHIWSWNVFGHLHFSFAQSLWRGQNEGISTSSCLCNFVYYTCLLPNELILIEYQDWSYFGTAYNGMQTQL